MMTTTATKTYNNRINTCNLCISKSSANRYRRTDFVNSVRKYTCCSRWAEKQFDISINNLWQSWKIFASKGMYKIHRVVVHRNGFVLDKFDLKGSIDITLACLNGFSKRRFNLFVSFSITSKNRDEKSFLSSRYRVIQTQRSDELSNVCYLFLKIAV